MKDLLAQLPEPDDTADQPTAAGEMARELTNVLAGGSGLSDQDVAASARTDHQDMKDRIEIPHQPVRLENGLLASGPSNADFVKEMTHELRTPLNVIIGLCQLLERDRKSPLSPTQRDAVQRMERNARALLEAASKLLDHVKSVRVSNH